MPDPIALSVVVSLLSNEASTWLIALQEKFLNKEIKNNLYDKKHIRQLELAFSRATEKGLQNFHGDKERGQYRDILMVLSEYQPYLAQEAAKLFTIDDNPNLVVLTKIYNFQKKNQASLQNKAFEEIDVAPYLICFFDALVAELYNDPLFRELVSDVIRTRAAIRGTQGVAQTVHHIEKQEVFMGDKVEGNKPTYNIGDISNSTVSGIVQGENNVVISKLNASGNTELAQALKALTDAIMESKDLPADQKEDQVKIVNQIGEEAAKPKPNKSLLKILGDGLLTTLKAIPDIASAVAAAAPVLTQLHL